MDCHLRSLGREALILLDRFKGPAHHGGMNYPTVFDEAWPTIRVRYHAGDDYTEVSVWHATIPDTRGALLLTRDIPALIARAARRPVPELWKVERYL